MDYKTGSRWKSSVCGTEIVIVRSPSAPGLLACGGVPVVPIDADDSPGARLDPSLAGGSLLGKRYEDADSRLEVLCTKAGEGTLGFEGRPLAIKGAKPLPSSD